MSHRVDPRAFAVRLRETIDDFGKLEALLRSEYAREHGSSDVPEEMTERATRRFLVDNIMRALDWDPGDPSKTIEEARVWHPSG